MTQFLIKHLAEPWLQWIATGRKRYEGRLKRGDWAQLKIGQKIRFYNLKRTVLVRVSGLQFFPDFGSAFQQLGKELIPEGAKTADEARKLYSQFYGDKDVAEFGVIAIKLEVIEE